MTLTLALPVHSDESVDDLRAWEEAMGDATHEDPGRYAATAPMASGGLRYPGLRRPGQVLFFAGLGAAAIFGGVGGGLLAADVHGDLNALIDVFGLALLAIGGTGGAVMITGGVLWGVSTTEYPQQPAALQPTPDGLRIAF